MIGLFLMMRRPTSCKRTTTPIPYTTLFRSTVHDSAAGSAHHRADPRYQLSRAERLAQVIIGTDRKPDDGVHFRTASSQHHHVCIRKCTKFPAYLDAVDTGQPEIEDHHIRIDLTCQGESVETVVEIGRASCRERVCQYV